MTPPPTSPISLPTNWLCFCETDLCHESFLLDKDLTRKSDSSLASVITGIATRALIESPTDQEFDFLLQPAPQEFSLELPVAARRALLDLSEKKFSSAGPSLLDRSRESESDLEKPPHSPHFFLLDEKNDSENNYHETTSATAKPILLEPKSAKIAPLDLNSAKQKKQLEEIAETQKVPTPLAKWSREAKQWLYDAWKKEPKISRIELSKGLRKLGVIYSSAQICKIIYKYFHNKANPQTSFVNITHRYQRRYNHTKPLKIPLNDFSKKFHVSLFRKGKKTAEPEKTFPAHTHTGRNLIKSKSPSPGPSDPSPHKSKKIKST